MERYKGRPLVVRTPLANDTLLMERLWAYEELNSMFTFQLDLFAHNEKDIPFDKLLGAELTVEVKFGANRSRFFSGIVCRFSQCGRDAVFTDYQAELVPKFWLLTKTTNSRIFQQKTVPEILAQV